MDKISPEKLNKLLSLLENNDKIDRLLTLTNNNDVNNNNNNDNDNDNDNLPTKLTYLTNLARKSTNFEQFCNNFALPKGSVEYLYHVGKVQFYSETIMDYIKTEENVPIFCSCKRNNKLYRIYNGNGWELRQNLNEFVKIICGKLLMALRKWEKENNSRGEIFYNDEIHKEWSLYLQSIVFGDQTTDGSINQAMKKINDILYIQIYEFHKPKYRN